MNEDKFYDQGWNDRVDLVPYDLRKPRDYRDGWKDCNDEIAEGNEPEKMTNETSQIPA